MQRIFDYILLFQMENRILVIVFVFWVFFFTIYSYTTLLPCSDVLHPCKLIQVH